MKFSLNYLQQMLLVSGVMLAVPALAAEWEPPEPTTTMKIYVGCNLEEFKSKVSILNPTGGQEGCKPVEEYTWTSGGTYMTGWKKTHGFFINGSPGGVNAEELSDLKTMVTSQGNNLENHTQSISNLEGQISTLNQQQNQQATSLNGIQDVMTGLNNSVTQNTQGITNNAERIQNLDGRVTQNTQGIASNAERIQNLDSRVTQNTQGIADNKIAIEQNKEMIVKGINITTDKGGANYQLGDTIKLLGGANIQTQQQNGNIVISLRDNPQFKGELNAQGGLVAHHYLVTPKDTLVDFGGNRLQNVGEAIHDNDAVNLRQLKQFGTHMNQEVKSLRKQLRQARKTAHAGTASALAVASMPQAWEPDQSGMSLGTAVYRGETGYALGLSRMSSSGRWVVKGALTADSRGGMGATVGAFFAFD